jgi:hypothetical protein
VLEFWLVLGCVMAVALIIVFPVSLALGWLLTHEPPNLARTLGRRNLLPPPMPFLADLAEGSGKEFVELLWLESDATPAGAASAAGLSLAAGLSTAVGMVALVDRSKGKRRFSIRPTFELASSPTEASGEGSVVLEVGRRTPRVFGTSVATVVNAGTMRVPAW